MSSFIDPNHLNFDGSSVANRQPARVVVHADADAPIELYALADLVYRRHCFGAKQTRIPGTDARTSEDYADGSRVVVTTTGEIDQVDIYPVFKKEEGGPFWGGISLQPMLTNIYPGGIYDPTIWEPLNDPPDIMPEIVDPLLPGENAPGVEERAADELNPIAPDGLILQIDPDATLSAESFANGEIRFLRAPTATGSIIDLNVEENRYLPSLQGGATGAFYVCGREVTGMPDFPDVGGHAPVYASPNWMYTFGFQEKFDWDYGDCSGIIVMGVNLYEDWSTPRHYVLAIRVGPNEDATDHEWTAWTVLDSNAEPSNGDGAIQVTEEVQPDDSIKYIFEPRVQTANANYRVEVTNYSEGAALEDIVGVISITTPPDDNTDSTLIGTHTFQRWVGEFNLLDETTRIKTMSEVLHRELRDGVADAYGWTYDHSVAVSVNIDGPGIGAYELLADNEDEAGWWNGTTSGWDAELLLASPEYNPTAYGQAQVDIDTNYGTLGTDERLGGYYGTVGGNYSAVGYTWTAQLWRLSWVWEVEVSVTAWGDGWTKTVTHTGAGPSGSPTYEAVQTTWSGTLDDDEITWEAHKDSAYLRCYQHADITVTQPFPAVPSLASASRDAVDLQATVYTPEAPSGIELSANLYNDFDDDVIFSGPRTRSSTWRTIRAQYYGSAGGVISGSTMESFFVYENLGLVRNDNEPQGSSFSYNYDDYVSTEKSWTFDGSLNGYLTSGDIGGTSGVEMLTAAATYLEPDFYMHPVDNGGTLTGLVSELPLSSTANLPDFPSKIEDYTCFIYDDRNKTWFLQLSRGAGGTHQSSCVYHEWWVGNRNGAVKLLDSLNGWALEADPERDPYLKTDILLDYWFDPPRLI